jgi:hypothetical protein
MPFLTSSFQEHTLKSNVREPAGLCSLSNSGIKEKSNFVYFAFFLNSGRASAAMEHL